MRSGTSLQTREARLSSEYELKNIFLLTVLKKNQQMFGGNGKNNFTLLNDKMNLQIKPLVERWSKQKLSSEVTIYGIRRYLRNSWLSLHVDKMSTHVLSAILQVGNVFTD